jgi:hypothetical protein
MACFSDTSLLAGIGMNDHDAIRRLMNALMNLLHATFPSEAASYADLNFNHELNALYRISALFARLPLNTVLLDMASRFATARYASDGDVLAAAADFDYVASEAIQHPVPDSPEYQEATNIYQSFLAGGHLPYRQIKEIERSSGFRADDTAAQTAEYEAAHFNQAFDDNRVSERHLDLKPVY